MKCNYGPGQARPILPILNSFWPVFKTIVKIQPAGLKLFQKPCIFELRTGQVPILTGAIWGPTSGKTQRALSNGSQVDDLYDR